MRFVLFYFFFFRREKSSRDISGGRGGSPGKRINITVVYIHTRAVHDVRALTVFAFSPVGDATNNCRFPIHHPTRTRAHCRRRPRSTGDTGHLEFQMRSVKRARARTQTHIRHKYTSLLLSTTIVGKRK